MPFNFNSQQDAAEVPQFVIDELKGTSVAASDLISKIIRINISCNQCFCFSAKEEKLEILTIPLSPNINSSLSKPLKPEILNQKISGSAHHVTVQQRVPGKLQPLVWVLF